MTDDDIRDMLRTKATEAAVSADAWDKIAVRLDETERKVRQLPRRLALVGVAAAAVAGTVVLANRSETDGPATQATTTTHVMAPPADAGEVRDAVQSWLAVRLPDVDPGTYDTVTHDDGTVTVRFKDGDLDAELVLQPLDSQKGYGVASVSTGLVLLNNPTYDGHEIVAEAIPAVEGQLTTTYYVSGGQDVANPGIQAIDGGTVHVTHETQPLGHPYERADSVTVQIVLTAADGTTGIAQEDATFLRDPATPTGSYVSVWPATDAVGLASLQQQADNGRRGDLLDPQGVAGNAFHELLPQTETSTGYHLGDFRKVDGYSGEVPYTLSEGGTGVIQLRRTADDDRRIWYVTGVTSDALQVLKYRHEPGALVIDVQSSVDGTLTLGGGDAPIEVTAGQKVSVSRPVKDDIQTGAPVELRVRVGQKTPAVLAELPR
jgi:hypothetical protein